ncbi:M20 metallopeptidase family protein [Peribacillus butanolivorans]|uniref:M20 metallopeptidase family protein n=1 Tax=Peribacillus butanolivorans TaxID=421767 RepID=UPI00366B39B8
MSVALQEIQIKEEVIKWRRYLHMYPELSYEEEKSSHFVYKTLLSFGNLEVSKPIKNSVIAKLKGNKPGRTIALRADMDALPITEETNVDFASKNTGVMHACGHDGHMAMLLGAAKILSQNQDKITGEIVFIFQHAEEQFPGGAKELVESGVLDGVDEIIGLHLMPMIDVGKIGITYGPAMAASDTFTLIIKGKGGHAAIPQNSVDSIAIAAQIVSNLQYIVSRNVDPLETVVISITQFVAESAINVIPDQVKLGGSVRSFNPELRKKLPAMLEKVIKGITEAHGAAFEFDYHYGYSPVINTDAVTKMIHETAVEVVGEDSVERMKPLMTGEDFSAYLEKTAGCFFFVGVRNESKGIVHPLHHPQFAIDEDSLDIGVSILVNTAIKLLNEKPV